VPGPRGRFAQLLGGPRRGGMAGDGDVHDASALVRDEQQDEQQTAGRRRHDEEIGGHHLSEVIRQKRAPGLRWRLAVAPLYFATLACETAIPSFNSSP
jgi:hypothetical protein